MKKEVNSHYRLFTSLCYLCEGMKDYRTFKEDFLKLVEFAEWYKDYIA